MLISPSIWKSQCENRGMATSWPPKTESGLALSIPFIFLEKRPFFVRNILKCLQIASLGSFFLKVAYLIHSNPLNLNGFVWVRFLLSDIAPFVLSLNETGLGRGAATVNLQISGHIPASFVNSSGWLCDLTGKYHRAGSTKVFMFLPTMASSYYMISYKSTEIG
jgi:hypothetical protein